MNIKKRQPILNLFLIILCIIIVTPFLLVVSVSLSMEEDIIKYGYSFWPRHIDFSAYQYIFNKPGAVIEAYKVTIIFSVVATVISVFMQAMIAYPLSRKIFKERQAISFFLYFTMLFSGGLVPSYILNTQYLHLDDTIWIYILPMLISPWNIFMIRTFFSGIPGEIIESAYMDGASEYKIFLEFILPLSKPVLATIALLTFLGRWNSWMESMLYINNQKLVSLQYLLQKILLSIQVLQDNQDKIVAGLIGNEGIPAETVRMAMAVIVAGPALVVFPFFQKYFVRGMTLGSVKG